MKERVLVSVLTITYKHESYISKTIEGVLSQEVGFGVELVIADDCSPDNTERVVKNYIENHPNGSWIVYSKHSDNLGMNKNFLWALNQCRGDYVAVCEGDDYWDDPMKLQKQVDFMEKNPSYNICYHNAKILRKNEVSGIVYQESPPKHATIKDYLNGYYTKTCTALVRRNSVILERVSKVPIERLDDTSFFLSVLGEEGKYYFMDDFMAIYREHEGGVWSMISYEKKLEQACLASEYKYKQFIKYREHTKVGINFKSNLLESFIFKFLKFKFRESYILYSKYNKMNFKLDKREKRTILKRALVNRFKLLFY